MYHMQYGWEGSACLLLMTVAKRAAKCIFASEACFVVFARRALCILVMKEQSRLVILQTRLFGKHPLCHT